MLDYEQLRHEREQIDAGARALRSRAISDGYAGLEHKQVAFGFASIVDGLSMSASLASDPTHRTAADYTPTRPAPRRPEPLRIPLRRRPAVSADRELVPTTALEVDRAPGLTTALHTGERGWRHVIIQPNAPPAQNDPETPTESETTPVA